MNEEWRFRAHELIKKQTVELVHAMGAEADITIDVGYPFVLNDESLNAMARESGEEYMGALWGVVNGPRSLSSLSEA